MIKIDGGSMDTKNLNIEQLRAIFPQVFKEGKIDFELLQNELGEYVESDREKYSFTWKGKLDSVRLAQSRSAGTLRPCKEDSKNWDTTGNLYIEGDNLEVLKLLQGSYLNRIKMIYIDPPYNTGNDFVYKDDFGDSIENYKKVTGQSTISNPETAGRYHTNWLNMMYPRLKLARNLLKDDGVIFISIDDNEQANLKKLCDEVFGEDNFVAQLPRVTKKGGKSSEVIAKNHDYVLIYRKSSEVLMCAIEHNDDGFKFKDEYFEARGYYKLNQTLDYDSLQYSKSLDYPIELDGKKIYAGGSKENYEQRQLGKHNRADWAWRWSKAKFNFGLENGFVVVKESKNGIRIYTKTYQKATIKDATNNYEILYQDRTKSMSTLDTVQNEFSNDNATKDLDAVLDKRLFDYSKPIALIALVLKLSTEKNDIILDFFSGSATTAHAVMQLNADDGGNRKFICVQLPEKTNEDSEAFKAGYKNICEIGKERIRRAGVVISVGKQDKYEKILVDAGGDLNNTEHMEKYVYSNLPKIDTGFKVFKLDSSNLIKWNNAHTDDVTEIEKRINHSMFYLVEGRSDLDMVYEIMLKYNLPLTLEVKEHKVQNITSYIITHEEYKVLICLDPNITIEVAEELNKLEIGTYIFADRCFADANMLINVEEILKKANKEMRLF